jgi:phytoene dehydrogenase-like protein
LDLRDYGFGRWNVFHSEQVDLNQAFDDMYLRGDYSKPSFVMTTPSLLTDERDCPEGHQIIEFLTVANYDRFHDLKISDAAKYRQKKKEIFDAIIAIVERDYIPDFSKHLVFKMTGSPTTNQRFCGSPAGNSYGSNLTPKNVNLNRLNHHTSLAHFYFCNASSGFPGFAGTIKTGCMLYEHLSKDLFIKGDQQAT